MEQIASSFKFSVGLSTPRKNVPSWPNGLEEKNMNMLLDVATVSGTDHVITTSQIVHNQCIQRYPWRIQRYPW